MTRIRIVVVDDHPIVRDGLRALLGTVPDTELVGEAANSEGAVREVTLHRPDVVLLDVHLPDRSGLDTLPRILAASPRTRVLMLTMYDDVGSVTQAVRNGASGYLVKGAGQDEILRSVRAVHAGQTVLGTGVGGHLAALAEGPESPVFPGLAPREREILDLVAAGLGNASIASRLALSPKTVANHLTVIFRKIAVADRGQAIVKARDAGLGRG